MFERFTDRARKVMALANEQTQRFGHEQIGTEHILLGLLKEGSGAGAAVLQNQGVDINKMLVEIEQILKLKGGTDMTTAEQLPQRPGAIKAIEYAAEEARALNNDHIGTEHILLGLLRQSDGITAQVLTNLGLKLEDVRQSLS